MRTGEAPTSQDATPIGQSNDSQAGSAGPASRAQRRAAPRAWDARVLSPRCLRAKPRGSFLP
jgi:hypothetical protein